MVPTFSFCLSLSSCSSKYSSVRILWGQGRHTARGVVQQAQLYVCHAVVHTSAFHGELPPPQKITSVSAQIKALGLSTCRDLRPYNPASLKLLEKWFPKQPHAKQSPRAPNSHYMHNVHVYVIEICINLIAGPLTCPSLQPPPAFWRSAQTTAVRQGCRSAKYTCTINYCMRILRTCSIQCTCKHPHKQTDRQTDRQTDPLLQTCCCTVAMASSCFFCCSMRPSSLACCCRLNSRMRRFSSSISCRSCSFH